MCSIAWDHRKANMGKSSAVSRANSFEKCGLIPVERIAGTTSARVHIQTIAPSYLHHSYYALVTEVNLINYVTIYHLWISFRFTPKIPAYKTAGTAWSFLRFCEPSYTGSAIVYVILCDRWLYLFILAILFDCKDREYYESEIVTTIFRVSPYLCSIHYSYICLIWLSRY